MSNPETKLKNELRIALQLRHSNLRIFNNPVGEGWAGKPSAIRGYGQVTLKYPSRVTYGLCVGSSDLIGWITLEGRAIFVALEIKTDTGRTSHDQENFIKSLASGVKFN